MSATLELYRRHLLTLDDLSREEIVYLIDLAAELKEATRQHREKPRLKGKKIALIFDPESTRARCAFEIAAFDQGAHVTSIASAALLMGRNEAVRDTARVLGRMYDAIEYLGRDRSVAEELARWAGVPVYMGSTHGAHPTQVLSDFLTFDEHLAEPLDDVAFCYLGDARAGMAAEYLVGGAKLGMDIRIASPRVLWPQPDIVAGARRIAARSGARVTVTDNLAEAVSDVSALLTSTWVSEKEPPEARDERIELLLPYQVNARLIELTGNPDVKFMHCLPALHNVDTRLGEEMTRRHGVDALEVTDDVFESPASLVFDGAENRLHTIKAVLVATLQG